MPDRITDRHLALLAGIVASYRQQHPASTMCLSSETIQALVAELAERRRAEHDARTGPLWNTVAHLAATARRAASDA